MSLVVLIDGSNVIHHAEWKRFVADEARELGQPEYGSSSDDLHRAAGRFLDWMMLWSSTRGIRTIVVFDGVGPVGAGDREWGSPGSRVIGSGAEDGDAIIEREAAKLRRGKAPFELVTDDNALAAVAGAGARVVRQVAPFIAEVTTRANADARATIIEAQDPATTGLAESLDDDVRAKLERMRRGLD